MWAVSTRAVLRKVPLTQHSSREEQDRLLLLGADVPRTPLCCVQGADDRLEVGDEVDGSVAHGSWGTIASSFAAVDVRFFVNDALKIKNESGAKRVAMVSYPEMSALTLLGAEAPVSLSASDSLIEAFISSVMGPEEIAICR